jgi:hypothetical protein
MSIDRVAADHFYKDDGDKIKQNWFLYEYANNLYTEIEESPALASYRKKHGKDNITAFCVYFSKRLRQSIFRAQTKQTAVVEINARYIYEFYPNNSRAQTQRLLNAAGSAWEEKVTVCSNCPNQCLTEGFERTAMFDNLANTGWPTV